MTANVLRTVLLDILLPIAAYFGLVSCGLTPAWALAASAVSRSSLSAPGGCGAASCPRSVSSSWSASCSAWSSLCSPATPGSCTLGLWVVGLIGEVAVAVAVIYTTPLAVVVIVTGVLTPVVLLSLIAVTQVRAGRAHGEASSTPTCHNADYRFEAADRSGPLCGQRPVSGYLSSPCPLPDTVRIPRHGSRTSSRSSGGIPAHRLLLGSAAPVGRAAHATGHRHRSLNCDVPVRRRRVRGDVAQAMAFAETPASLRRTRPDGRHAPT